MLKRLQKHIRSTEKENEIQELLENTTYYEPQSEEKEEEVFNCRLCDMNISKMNTLLE
jgi:hypothetical protein